MKFGAMVVPRIADWQIIPELESLGYDSVWVPDSQMLYSDCYAVLALAAAHTSRIRLGTGVAIAPTRLAPVTAHSIATINSLAPGRTFLALGTGHTAMRVMGRNPMGVDRFRDYVRVVRALLHGEEVAYGSDGGKGREIRFLHPDLGFVNVEHPVPVYVAADGPRALRVVGAYADGRGLFAQPDQGAAPGQSGTHRGGCGRGRPHPAGRVSHRRTHLCLCPRARREHDIRAGDRRDRLDGDRDAALLVGTLPAERRYRHGGPQVSGSLAGIPGIHCSEWKRRSTSATSRFTLATARGPCRKSGGS